MRDGDRLGAGRESTIPPPPTPDTSKPLAGGAAPPRPGRAGSPCPGGGGGVPGTAGQSVGWDRPVRPSVRRRRRGSVAVRGEGGGGRARCGDTRLGAKKRHLVGSRWLAGGLIASKGVSSPFSENP